MDFYDLYSPFHGLDAKDNDQWTVKNCFIHMLTEGRIDIEAFRRLIEDGGVSGDIDWGIEKWNTYSEEDHGIKSSFDGDLFCLGEAEPGPSRRGDFQVILRGQKPTPSRNG